MESCKKGFYKDGNDGAVACKAQAMFIEKYGKESFLQAQNELHKRYDFKKTQEVLGENLTDAMAILKDCLK